MIFEIYIPGLDIALGGGGRYDRLIEAFGGEPTPAVGFAHGIDRIAIATQTQKTALTTKAAKKVAVLPITETMKVRSPKNSPTTPRRRVTVEFEVMGRKMAKALEDADKRKVDYAVIVGERELKEGAVVLKDLAKREQSTIVVDKLVEKIKS